MDILGMMRERAGDYDCPRCHAALRECTLTTLRHADPEYTVQVTCAACTVSFVVVLQVRERPEAPSARRRRAARADRRPAEAAPEAPAPPPITSDELLSVHEYLRDHRGPITDLLRAADRS